MCAGRGEEVELEKYDIKAGFRLLRVHPLDFELLGLAFEGQFYTEGVLPWVVPRFSMCLEWAWRQHTGLTDRVYYLVDFLYVGACGTRNVLSW